MSIISLQTFELPSDETEETLAYPLHMPRGSYITDGGHLLELSGAFDEFWSQADDILKQQNLPSMLTRIPVIAYGSNANPRHFAEKMGQYGKRSTSLVQTAPFQDAIVDGKIVWHGKPGQSGGVFADLYRGPLISEGSQAPAKLAWLTREQLAVLHTTEGITYQLTEIPALAGEDKQPIKAYAYTAGHSSILLKNGRPVPLRRISELPSEDSMTAEEAVAYMLSLLPASRSGDLPHAKSPRQLIKEMSRQRLDDKKAIQNAIAEVLLQKGANQTYSYPALPQDRIGRADFNFVDNYKELHLLEEVVSPLRPTESDIIDATGSRQPQAIQLAEARKRMDIMGPLRSGAHNELAQRLQYQNQ